MGHCVLTGVGGGGTAEDELHRRIPVAGILAGRENCIGVELSGDDGSMDRDGLPWVELDHIDRRRVCWPVVIWRVHPLVVVEAIGGVLGVRCAICGWVKSMIGVLSTNRL